VSRSEQYYLTIEQRADRFGCDTATAKNDNPIGHPDHLLSVVANEDDRDPLGRKMGDDAMDFRFCPDVYTSCRLVENENSRGWNQPFR